MHVRLASELGRCTQPADLLAHWLRCTLFERRPRGHSKLKGLSYRSCSHILAVRTAQKT